MTTKTRIQRIEKNAPKQETETPIFQSEKNGVIHVHWLSGRVTVEAELMPNIKTYIGVCPCDFDATKADE
jgi:hypothetical protein